RALTARNDRTGMTHALARRRGNAGDKAYHRFLHVVLDPACAGFLCIAADLADHDDSIGVRIIIEHAQHVDVLQARNRIAADTDDGRLTQTEFSQLTSGFIGQRTRTRNDADTAFLVDMRSEEHTSELQSRENLVCRLLHEKKKNNKKLLQRLAKKHVLVKAAEMQLEATMSGKT